MEQKAEPVISDFKNRDKPKKIIHMLLPKLLVGILLLAAIIVIVVLINDHRKNEPRTGVCSKGLVNRSFDNAARYNQPALAANVSNIEKLSGYQHDPNCMYIVTIYNVDDSNINRAESSLKLFNAAYNGHNLDSVLLKYASVYSLRQYVSNLSKTIKQEISNTAELSPNATPGTSK